MNSVNRTTVFKGEISNNRITSAGQPALGTLIASASMRMASQQFAIPGVRWHISGFNGGSVERVGEHIRMKNPIPTGGVFTITGVNVYDIGIREAYVEFSARYPDAIWGSKFCKFHGKALAPPDGNGYGANCTYGQNAVGDNNYLGYGDGVSLGQDVNQAIYLDGGAIYLGRNAGIAEIVVAPTRNFTVADWTALDSQGNRKWHNVRIHSKFNTGTTAQNEVPDGEFFIEINGEVYLHIRNMFNRHYLNPPLEEVNVGGWTDSDPNNRGPAFDLDVKNLRVSIGGWSPAV